MWSVPANFIGEELRDGTIALRGPDGRFYHRHYEGYRPIWDRPVEPELLP